MPPSPEQIAKLPAWARSRIEVLEMDKASLEAEIRRILGAEKPKPYAPTIQPFDHAKPSVQLPAERIYFPMQNIMVYQRPDGELEASARDGFLFVAPQASNSVRLFSVHHMEASGLIRGDRVNWRKVEGN